MKPPPYIVLISGPNGSGKSTFARFVLPEAMTFVNADEIAKTLPAHFEGNREITAGRLLIERITDLSDQGKSFAIETTLASRTLAPRITKLKNMGYRFHLVFLWLPTPDLAIARVASRFLRGGHNIPELVIRRRYASGLQNLFSIYLSLADSWQVYQNVDVSDPVVVASKGLETSIAVALPTVWEIIQRQVKCKYD